MKKSSVEVAAIVVKQGCAVKTGIRVGDDVTVNRAKTQDITVNKAQTQ